MPIQQFPHCDQRVLHKPGDCTHCDTRPEWQELRIAWGINFTGGRDEDKQRCPSELLREDYEIHQWPGNRPTNVQVPLDAPSAFERLMSPENEIE